MADSQELEPQLSAQEALQHRAAVIDAAVENIARANMVNVDPSQYLQNQHFVARLATSEAVSDQERLSA